MYCLKFLCNNLLANAPSLSVLQRNCLSNWAKSTSCLSVDLTFLGGCRDLWQKFHKYKDALP